MGKSFRKRLLWVVWIFIGFSALTDVMGLIGGLTGPDLVNLDELRQARAALQSTAPDTWSAPTIAVVELWGANLLGTTDERLFESLIASQKVKNEIQRKPLVTLANVLGALSCALSLWFLWVLAKVTNHYRGDQWDPKRAVTPLRRMALALWSIGTVSLLSSAAMVVALAPLQTEMRRIGMPEWGFNHLPEWSLHLMNVVPMVTGVTALLLGWLLFGWVRTLETQQLLESEIEGTV